jgi:CDGSH-type Zn-finger protein
MENTNQILVKTTKNGPYVIKGNFTLDLPTGETKECNGSTFLCQCGNSQNKPFCDESHKKSVVDAANVWF